MVCVYCGGETQVVNSRLQKRVNSVWRRRRCVMCGATFTSTEHSAYQQAITVTNAASDRYPFERDRLFLSIYEACRHRSSAIADATALTDTILIKLLPAEVRAGSVSRAAIVAAASNVLQHFDNAAYVHYRAFHSS